MNAFSIRATIYIDGPKEQLDWMKDELRRQIGDMMVKKIDGASSQVTFSPIKWEDNRKEVLANLRVAEGRYSDLDKFLPRYFFLTATVRIYSEEE